MKSLFRTEVIWKVARCSSESELERRRGEQQQEADADEVRFDLVSQSGDETGYTVVARRSRLVYEEPET
jgi:hypothetical protein